MSVLSDFLIKSYYIAYNFINKNRVRLTEKNSLFYKDSYLSKVIIQVTGENNCVSIGKNTKISNLKITIWGSDNRLVIGENCSIKGGELYFCGENCNIIISDDTSIIAACISVLEKRNSIKIGRDCMFAWGIDIRCGDGHPIVDIDSGLRLNPTKDILIQDHVWLAANVQVLKGVSIGKNCIIGARSVVTKDIPQNSLAVGVPAKVIKSNVMWNRK